MNKPIFGIVLTMAVASVILTIQITADAQNEEPQVELSIEEPQVELSIEELKRISLEEGKIFDDYLIPYEMSPAVINHFGGLNQTLWSYNHLNDLLEYSKGDPYLEKTNGFLMLSFNFDVLTDTVVAKEKIAALVIQERKLAETYQQPDLEPLQKLHTYLEAEYPINATTPSLKDMFGDMSIFAPEILEIEETAALLGKPPYKMHESDLNYWFYVGLYGDCEIIENGANCAEYLEEAKAWEQSSKEEKDFQIGVDNIDVPKIYTSINYQAEVYTINCQQQGVECDSKQKTMDVCN